MKKNSAIYACTTAIVILLASLIGCDCVTATDWGFGPIQPEAAEVESANVMAMKTPAPGPQEVVCENGVCRLVETATVSASGFAPVYVMEDAVCPCGCGIAGCACGGGSFVSVYRSSNASWLASHLSGDHGIDVTGMSEAQMESIHDSLHGGGFRTWGFGAARGNGYGVFGLRERPRFWRFRPFLRMRMGW